MPIKKVQVEGRKSEVECEMLRLPYTMPDDGSGFQLLSVVEDMEHDCKMHVNFADVMDYAESWGAYLADVAHVMTRDYAHGFDTAREDEDLFAAICDGFKQRAEAIKQSPEPR
jgi:hypothetical protein